MAILHALCSHLISMTPKYGNTACIVQHLISMTPKYGNTACIVQSPHLHGISAVHSPSHTKPSAHSASSVLSSPSDRTSCEGLSPRSSLCVQEVCGAEDNSHHLQVVTTHIALCSVYPCINPHLLLSTSQRASAHCECPDCTNNSSNFP